MYSGFQIGEFVVSHSAILQSVLHEVHVLAGLRFGRSHVGDHLAGRLCSATHSTTPEYTLSSISKPNFRQQEHHRFSISLDFDDVQFYPRAQDNLLLNIARHDCSPHTWGCRFMGELRRNRQANEKAKNNNN